MKINMYAVCVRFVQDAKGLLDDKAQWVIVTIARDHNEAADNARGQYKDIERAGVKIEYSPPMQLPDSVAVESLRGA